MKEVIIILVVLVLVTILGVFEQKYIDNNTSDLIYDLSIIKNEIIEQKQIDAIKKMNDVHKKWDDIKTKLAIIIDHEHIDNVGQNIAILKTGLEENLKEDVMKEIDKTIFLLNDIKDINKFKLKNIF